MNYVLNVSKVNKGETILEKGQIATNIYFILKGECKLMRQGASLFDGISWDFIIIGRGSSFGEESVFYKEPAAHNIQVNPQKACLVYIKKQDIKTLPSLVTNQL